MSTTVSHPHPTAQAQAIADLTGYEDAATQRWQQACVQAANTLTALPNGRYVNVRMERMREGLELAQRGAVTLLEDKPGQDILSTSAEIPDCIPQRGRELTLRWLQKFEEPQLLYGQGPLPRISRRFRAIHDQGFVRC